jgi:hypothetical protein
MLQCERLEWHGRLWRNRIEPDSGVRCMHLTTVPPLWSPAAFQKLLSILDHANVGVRSSVFTSSSCRLGGGANSEQVLSLSAPIITWITSRVSHVTSQVYKVLILYFVSFFSSYPSVARKF